MLDSATARAIPMARDRAAKKREEFTLQGRGGDSRSGDARREMDAAAGDSAA